MQMQVRFRLSPYGYRQSGTVGQVFLGGGGGVGDYLICPPVSVISPVLCIHLFVTGAV